MTTLLIDADDTLWENIVVFNQVNAAYVDWLLPGRTLAEMQSDLDALQVDCIARFGYGRDTFEKSLIEGVHRFANRSATTADRAHISSLVQPLQWETLDIRDGVVETLEILVTRAHLLLVTKGDRVEQRLKIDRSGLERFFAGIEILETKAPAEYAQTVADYQLDPDTTWMVGNSPRSDITPALSVGLGAVFIPHAETWSHEHAGLGEHPRLIEMASFRELTTRF